MYITSITHERMLYIYIYIRLSTLHSISPLILHFPNTLGMFVLRVLRVNQ
jgi:hypothetical protein